MPGLTLWGASLHHPAFSKLSMETKYVFIELANAYMDANNHDLPDGFIHPEFLLVATFSKEQAEQALADLEQAGIVEKIDDPQGWLIKNFNTTAERYRPSVEELKLPFWGQQTLAEIQRRAKSNADSSKQYRDKQKQVSATNTLETEH